MAAAFPGLKVDFANIDEFLVELVNVPEVTAGVASVGDAAAYALVWEWGNTRQKKPGPKTVKGTNPDGKMVWLSSQAPFGYIRIHEPEYWQVIEEEMSSVDLNKLRSKQEITSNLRNVAKRAVKKIKIIFVLYDFLHFQNLNLNTNLN